MAAINKSKQLLDPSETSFELGVSVTTLAIWRSVKRYDLPYLKIGKKIFYELAEIEAFKNRNKHQAEVI